MEYTYEALKRIREQSLKEAEDLKAKYGTGIRPSWVSYELTMAYANARRAQEMMDALEK